MKKLKHDNIINVRKQDLNTYLLYWAPNNCVGLDRNVNYIYDNNAIKCILNLIESIVKRLTQKTDEDNFEVNFSFCNNSKTWECNIRTFHGYYSIEANGLNEAIICCLIDFFKNDPIAHHLKG